MDEVGVTSTTFYWLSILLNLLLGPFVHESVCRSYKFLFWRAYFHLEFSFAFWKHVYWWLMKKVGDIVLKNQARVGRWHYWQIARIIKVWAIITCSTFWSLVTLSSKMEPKTSKVQTTTKSLVCYCNESLELVACVVFIWRFKSSYVWT